MLTNIQLINEYWLANKDAYWLGHSVEDRDGDFRLNSYNPDYEDFRDQELANISQSYHQSPERTRTEYYLGQWYRVYGDVRGWFNNPNLNATFEAGFRAGCSDPEMENIPDEAPTYLNVWWAGYRFGALITKLSQFVPEIEQCGYIWN